QVEAVRIRENLFYSTGALLQSVLFPTSFSMRFYSTHQILHFNQRKIDLIEVDFYEIIHTTNVLGKLASFTEALQ
ncbi:MAG: hypothetical protein KAQ62_18975, partial [Cyclobacteriaceae bacterium]|nr:hypothetical protein [Cyclobacteriaceae bacterium]